MCELKTTQMSGTNYAYQLGQFDTTHDIYWGNNHGDPVLMTLT